METVYPININDARTYVLPVTNIIGRRLNRISTLNNKLISLIAKLYTLPDTDDKTEICTLISKTISEIELLVLKNIDDTQILEYSLAEFTLKPTQSVETPPKTNVLDQHAYFA